MRQLASPHGDERPDASDINLLVIHNISLPPGEFGGDGVAQLFLGTLDCDAHLYYQQLRGLRVSAHLFIRRDGEVIQFVPYAKRAWHAGVSVFQGRPRCNDFSIGIELEGCDDLPYSEAQYLALAAVSRDIMRRFAAITPARIVGHNDIAPGRKTDPGPAFDWPRFRLLLSKE